MKEHNASKGAECRHPVRRRHGAFIAMYEAKATKQLSSAIVISSSRFALLFLGASFSAAPTAAAVDHAAAAITPTERRRSVWKCVPRAQRLSSPGEGHRAAVLPFQHGTQANVPTFAETLLQSTVQLLMRVGICWRSKKKEHREAHQQSKRNSWMTAIHAVRTQPQQSRTVAALTKNNKKQSKKHGGRVWLCAWRCGCLPALAAKKTKQEGKKCVLRPTGPRRTPTRHGSLSAPFVAAPPHACSRRGAQGRRHERVGGCASGAVGRKHTAPLTGRVQQQTIK
ncbi:hypothetical protein TcCL_NonESM11906, partial [Trypanosoma cruzi]